jgi:hypothetical protein
MQDKKDEIVDIRGSLMAGVANEIISHEIGKNNYQPVVT